ncbi:amidohydrolase [Microbacterium sp. H1-D42]|uniref:amidohydrolase n=1 Tax=Microbacterium sp. H1-D42 TaxID=2925844 RepID=UPI001F530EEE|nr:amidohydrolase [Microbacterium sp. H1-D42]UNK70758.1 amidohydrolase [Microbacterium sp. H1-D42]
MTAQARMLLSAFSQLEATDTMCHLGQWPYRLSAGSDADGLRVYAARHGLRALWVSHLSALFGFETRTGNEAALAACAGDDLFRFFAVIDPSEAGWREELDWAADAGAHGIRVAPGFHRYPVHLVADLIDAAAEHAIPVQVIARMDDARVRHPLSPAHDLEVRDLAELLRARPVHPLVLSGLNALDWHELSRHLGDDAPASVRLDIWHINGPTGVADGFADDPGRWVFGSGYPVQTPEATMLQLMASSLSADDLATITTA